VASTSLTALRQAVPTVEAGGLIAYPTEGVFGLGCRPDAHAALERLLALKGRSAASGFILIANDWAQLDGWIAPAPEEAVRVRKRTRKPVTWIVTAGPRAHALVTGGRATLACRVTSHRLAAALCALADTPLVSTSANRHGRPPALTALAVRRRFGAEVDCVVAGATGGARGPSEIRVARTGKVLRPG